MDDLTRPIIGIENRTPQEVFDIMCDRFKGSSVPMRLRCAEDIMSDGYNILTQCDARGADALDVHNFLLAARAHMEKYHGR